MMPFSNLSVLVSEIDLEGCSDSLGDGSQNRHPSDSLGDGGVSIDVNPFDSLGDGDSVNDALLVQDSQEGRPIQLGKGDSFQFESIDYVSSEALAEHIQASKNIKFAPLKEEIYMDALDVGLQKMNYGFDNFDQDEYLWKSLAHLDIGTQERVPYLPINEIVNAELLNEIIDPDFAVCDIDSEVGIASGDYEDVMLLLHSCETCPAEGLCPSCRNSKEFKELLHPGENKRGIRHLRRVASHFLDVALKVHTMDQRTRNVVRNMARKNIYARFLISMSKAIRVKFTSKCKKIRAFWRYLGRGYVNREEFHAHGCTDCTETLTCLACQQRIDDEQFANRRFGMPPPPEDTPPSARGAAGIIPTIMGFFNSAIEFTVKALDGFITSVRSLVSSCYSWIGSIVDTIFDRVIRRLKDSLLRIFTADIPTVLRKHWGKIFALMLVCILVDVGLCGEKFLMSLLKFTVAACAVVPAACLLGDIPYACAGVDRTELWRHGLDYWNDGYLPDAQKASAIVDQELAAKFERSMEAPPPYSPPPGSLVADEPPPLTDEDGYTYLAHLNTDSEPYTTTEAAIFEAVQIFVQDPVSAEIVCSNITMAINFLIVGFAEQGAPIQSSHKETIYHALLWQREEAQRRRIGEGYYLTHVHDYYQTLHQKFQSLYIQPAHEWDWYQEHQDDGPGAPYDWSDYESVGADWDAHTGVDTIATIVAICSACFGPSAIGSENVVKMLKMLALTSVAGTALSTIGSKLLFLLPVAVKSYLGYLVSDDAGKAKQEVEDWSVMALALNKVSKIPAVLASADFATYLAQTIENGRLFVQDRRLNNDTRALFLPLYLQLLRVQSCLVQIKENGRDRLKPFSFHLSGPPGVGKSFMVRNLCEDVFGTQVGDYWNRPIGGEFWSGYINQKVVIYDEFLIGDEPTYVNTIAREYLGLVSTGQFMPEFASMDSPSVGIKGTAVAPSIVCTINNTDYDAPPSFDRTAIQRRREFVIKCRVKQGAHLKRDGQVDLKRYSAQEIRDHAWMEFMILEPVFSRNALPQIAVTYPLLVRFMKYRYARHLDLQSAIMGDRDDPTIEPQTVILDAIRQVQTVPSGPIDITGVLANFVAHISDSEDEEETPMNSCRSQNTSLDVQDLETDTEVETSSSTRTTRRNGSRSRRPRRDLDLDMLNLMDRLYTRFRDVESGQNILEQQLGLEKEKPEVTNPGVDPEALHHGPVREYIEHVIYEDDLWNMKKILVEDEAELMKIKWEQYDPMGYLAEYVAAYAKPTETRSYWWIGVIGAGVAIVCALFLARRFLGYEDGQLYFAHSPRPNSNRKKESHKRTMKRTVGWQAHSGDSYCYLSAGGVSARVTGLGSGWFLTFYHGLDAIMRQDTTAILKDSRDSLVIDFTKIQIVTDRGNDFAVFHVPAQKNRPGCKNIVNKFISDQDLQKCESFSLIMNKTTGPVFGSGKVMPGRAYRTKWGDSYRHETALLTNMASQHGDCGCLVQINSGPYEGKYVGMNVAGANAGYSSARSISSIITKEMLIEAMGGIDDVDYSVEADFEAHLLERLECPKTERVYLNRKTQLKPSAIRESLLESGFQQTKWPAVLSKDDPRGPGVNPEEVAIGIMADYISTEIDPDYVESLVEQMYHDHKEVMTYPIGVRELTFEEACGGIPGVLSSINTSTSPGYPLIFERKKRGKKDFVWFDENGELGYTEEFRMRVFHFLECMAHGDEPNHVWMGYLKDELVKESKISTGRTRIIYASSLIANVAFRMKFGYLIIAYQSNFGKSFSCCGMNQYSWDMNTFEQYLSEVGPTNRCVAGDYQAFDMRHNKIMRDLCYRIMFAENALEAGRTPNEVEFFIEHETCCVVQIGTIRFKVGNLHCSGCILTRVVNDWVNEGYLRYCFDRLNPGKVFRKNVRAGGMGDDHVANSSPNVNYSGRQIKTIMEGELGQRYTSDTKEEDPGEYRDFADTTFCGAHPRMIQGAWSGALKKSTLQNALLYTRNGNVTLVDECKQMVELASQWDLEFYTWYQTAIVKALKQWDPDLSWTWMSHKFTQRNVAERLACRGFDFVAVSEDTLFEAHSMEPDRTIYKDCVESPAVRQPRRGVHGLVGLHTNQVTCQDHIVPGNKLYSRATCESPMDMNFGVDSAIIRKQFDWTNAYTQNQVIFSVDLLPWDLLKLGNVKNLQNMPFDRFVLWHGDIEILVQTNGTPFQQGRLICYFMPLTKECLPDIVNAQAAMHVKIAPNRNTTARLRIPFRYFRDYLLTKSEESLGSIHFQVYAPLKSKQANSVTVTVYSSFPDSTFLLPRPEKIYGEARESLEAECEYEAHGNTYSTTNVGDVSGHMTFEGGNASGSGSGNRATVGMDNPSKASGAVPVQQQFSGLCKSVGVETTVSMQCNPGATYLHGENYLDQTETTIPFLASRPGILCCTNIDTSQPVDDILVAFDMESYMAVPDKYWEGTPFKNKPLCSAVLEHFYFWHADLVITIELIRNDYQTCRLRGVVAYGTVAKDFKAAEKDIYYNEVMDFTAEKDTHTIVMPYNGTQEFMKCSGAGAGFVSHDYTPGCFVLMVANQLIAPSTTVVNNVDIIVSVSYRNVRVACPVIVPYLPLAYQNLKRTVTDAQFFVDVSTTQPSLINNLQPDDDYEFVAHVGDDPGSVVEAPTPERGADEPIVSGEGVSGHDMPNGGVSVTSTCVPGGNVAFRTQHDNKFPYCINTIYDLARRARPFHRQPESINYTGWTNSVKQFKKVITYLIKPEVPFMGCFAGWSGELRLRIYLNADSGSFDAVMFTPTPVTGTKALDVAGVTNSLTRWQGLADAVDTTNNYFARWRKESHWPIPSGAFEVPYVLSADKEFIDVQIPFMTHYNFILIEEDENDHTERLYIGKLHLVCKPNFTSIKSIPKADENSIYIAGADSFRLGIFRPPNSVKAFTVVDKTPKVKKGDYEVYGKVFSFQGP